jgi:hypothetical protein
VSPRLLAAVALVVMGCGHGVARDQNGYRDATREVVTAHNDRVKSCYDAALAREPTLAGRVTLKFKVEAETGKVLDPQVDRAATTAPESLSQCVVQAVSGLALAPPDKNEGHASFSWEFKPGGA